MQSINGPKPPDAVHGNIGRPRPTLKFGEAAFGGIGLLGEVVGVVVTGSGKFKTACVWDGCNTLLSVTRLTGGGGGEGGGIGGEGGEGDG